jgi:hypothetical protein
MSATAKLQIREILNKTLVNIFKKKNKQFRSSLNCRFGFHTEFKFEGKKGVLGIF